MLALAILPPDAVVDLNTCRRLDTNSRALVVEDAYVVPPVGHLNRVLLLKIVYWLIVLARKSHGLSKKILQKQLVEDVVLA